jgi:DNA-binding winged helix-turn-helix (wHTH) protein
MPVWGDVAVTEDVVRLSIGELRAALSNERATPRFIQPVPRRAICQRQSRTSDGSGLVRAQFGRSEEPR